MSIAAPIYRTFFSQIPNFINHECHPFGFESMQIEGKRDGDSVYIRRHFGGKFIFRNVPKEGWFDYDFFKAIEEGPDSCEPIEVTIERSCDNGQTWQEWWFGQFTVTDGEFDVDRCVFETEIPLYDNYACLEQNGDLNQNIIFIPNEYTVFDPGILKSYEFFISTNTALLCTFFTSPTGAAWGLPFDDDCNSAQPGRDFFFWWREYRWTGCVAGNPVPPAGAGWILDTNDCATTGMAKYVRVPVEPAPVVGVDLEYNPCVTNPTPPPHSGVWELVGADCPQGWSWWWDRPPAPGTDYTHCRTNEDVIEFVTVNACTDISGVISDFFEINPDGTAPGYVAGNNYVTGLANQVSNLMWSDKSDILLPTASQPATIANITFNQLMNYFEYMFEVVWFIDSSNRIRLEHRSYFQHAQVLDLTVSPYDGMLRGRNKYSWIKDRRPKYEKFKWMEANGPDFVGYDITYPQVCVSPTVGAVRGNTRSLLDENSVTYDVDQITTDIEYISASPADISREGFVLMSTTPDGSGGYILNSEVGLVTGNAFQNAHLSWANLHYNYHRYYRVLLSGTMNNVSETFFSARPTKQQSGIIIRDCCGNFDDAIFANNVPGYVTTVIGNGLLDEYTKKLKNEQLTIKLVY